MADIDELKDTYTCEGSTFPPVFLELFHGRTDPEQDMDDWGETGPILGPLRFVHATYQATLHIARAEHPDSDLVFMDEDMFFYDGVWYGDYSVCCRGCFDPKDFAARYREFDPTAAVSPREVARHKKLVEAGNDKA